MQETFLKFFLVGAHFQKPQWTYWTWKIRHGLRGRPCVAKETRELIRTLSRDNVGWGAPRIHSELLKLGIKISEASVAKYMVRHPKPPSQTWRTFLKNHATQLASIDFFTVPTALFRILFVFIVIQHDRRRLVHFNVTAHPTAEWTARQILEAFPFDLAIYGHAFREQVAVMQIKEARSAAVSMAKGLRGACDRFDPARMFGSRDSLGRRRITPRVGCLYPLLQSCFILPYLTMCLKNQSLLVWMLVW